MFPNPSPLLRENELRSSYRKQQKEKQREYWAELETIGKSEDLSVSGSRKRLLTSSGMFRDVHRTKSRLTDFRVKSLPPPQILALTRKTTGNGKNSILLWKRI